MAAAGASHGAVQNFGPDLTQCQVQFASTMISARVNLIVFVALFISFPLVPHVLGVRIDLLNHLISQSWLITFTLVLSKGSVAPQANERTLERVLGARIRF